MSVRVKICGLTTREAVRASVEAGAAYLGFNFFPRSPRFVSNVEARALALEVPPGVAKVGLTVDAGDPELDAIVAEVPLDMLQLHGGEAPERVTEIRTRYGLPVIKALGIAVAADLRALDRYAAVADQLLVEAKPPPDADRPGGNATAFDWQLVAGRRWPVPWLLAGGLHIDNVAEAIRVTGAQQIDVSSGVESAPGVKDHSLIRRFIAAAG